jgi:hypothetical protein
MISKAEILDRASEREIFSYYMNECIDMRKKYRNPLRVDREAGCYFKVSAKTGRLNLIDMAYPEKTCDCFKLVQGLFNCSFIEALNKINEDLHLGLVNNFSDATFLTKERYVSKPQNNATTGKSSAYKPNFIEVSKANWSEETYAYWARFGLDKEDLQKYKPFVFPVSKVLISNRLYFSNTKDADLCYAYHLGETNGIPLYKIYRPIGDPKFKWRTNLTIHCNCPFFGLNLLPRENDNLIITSSLKDQIVLDSLGIPNTNIISLTSTEAQNIDKESIIGLQLRFKKVFLLMDSDPAGQAVYERLGMGSVGNIVLPAVYSDEIGRDLKDPAEFAEVGLRDVIITTINNKVKEVNDEITICNTNLEIEK